MAITSTFYDTKPGKGVNEIEWAQSARSRGTVYGVASAQDLLCTVHPSTPYTVNIGPAPGGFWGHGVWDTSDAVVSLTFAPPAPGARRFDLVAGRRDWTPTGGGPTTITGVQGSSSRQLPSSRLSRPGEVDDQPLWLIEWLGGQTQPQSITDLRLIGGRSAKDSLAFRFLKVPGMDVYFEGRRWEYLPVDSNGNWDWVAPAPPVRRGEFGAMTLWQPGQAWGPGLFDRVPAGTTDTSFYSPNRDLIWLPEAGAYDVLVRCFVDKNITGASFIRLMNEPETVEYVSADFTPGYRVATIAFPGFYAPRPMNIRVRANTVQPGLTLWTYVHVTRHN